MLLFLMKAYLWWVVVLALALAHTALEEWLDILDETMEGRK